MTNPTTPAPHDAAPAQPQEIAALTERAEKAEKRNRHLEHVARCQRDLLSLQYGETGTDAIRRVVAERDALTALIPATWYADRNAAWRLEALVEQWRRLIEVNRQLQDQCDAATKILDHANRAIDERRVVIEELTARAEAAEAQSAAMRAALEQYADGANWYINRDNPTPEYHWLGDDGLSIAQNALASNSGAEWLAALKKLKIELMMSETLAGIATETTSKIEQAFIDLGNPRPSGTAQWDHLINIVAQLRAEREAAQRVLEAAEGISIIRSIIVQLREKWADPDYCTWLLLAGCRDRLSVELEQSVRERRAGEGGAKS